jgi:hypothetical protein
MTSIGFVIGISVLCKEIKEKKKNKKLLDIPPINVLSKKFKDY